MAILFFSGDEIPNGFKYPEEYISIMLKCNFVEDIEPWTLICEFEISAKFWLLTLKKQYPDRKLIPFAKLSYSDDIACFDGDDLSGNPRVLYIHAFASAGWEDRGYVDSFSEWLELARSESEKYKSERYSE